jgi:hypothetical protein
MLIKKIPKRSCAKSLGGKASSYVRKFANKHNSHILPFREVAPFTMKKKVSDFPVPSRDVTDQTLPGRE